MMKTTPRRRWAALVPALVLALSAACVLSVALHVSQPPEPHRPVPIRFQGEYSWNGTDWLPLAEDGPEGDGGELFLRGHFSAAIPAGLRLNYFRDHIGGTMRVNGAPAHTSGQAAWERAGRRPTSAVCGRVWDYWLSTGVYEADEVELHLYRGHAHGSRAGFRELLRTLRVTADDDTVMEESLKSHRLPFQTAGIFTLIMGVLTLGAALTAGTLGLPLGKLLLVPSLAVLAGGGLMLFDVTLPPCCRDDIAFYTYGRQLCLMLLLYLLGLCVMGLLTGHSRKVASWLMLGSGLVNAACLLLACAGTALLCDTEFYWRAVQWVVTAELFGCCLYGMYRHRRFQLYHLSSVFLLGAVLLDLGGVGGGVYSTWSCVKLALLGVVLFYMGYTVRNAIVNQQAAARAEKLERELEDSRVSILLSQLQPHFLYNVLNSIYYLCRHDPETARDMIDKFSDYLRNNMAAVERTELVPFREEYQHVQTYLSLERLRFPKTLRVVWDIETENFRLPPLSVQPLVENAVRHGVTKKEGGGTVRLMTRETAESFVVTVADTGNGFDPAHYMDDGQPHIGIRNVRGRLAHMCGGTLEIISAPGTGTAAVITIPKRRD